MGEPKTLGTFGLVCPFCAAGLIATVIQTGVTSLRHNGQVVMMVDVEIGELRGCRHADAWTRGPRPPGGGMAIEFAEEAA